MRKFIRFILLIAVMSAFVGCHSFRADSARLQRQLHNRIHYAERQTADLVLLLERHAPMDSIRMMAEVDRNLLFYVFDAHQMVYWSNNWLSSNEVYLHAYDEWNYLMFHNAHTIARWTKADDYNILTVIPIRYAYPLETRLLKNSFVQPFDVKSERGVTRHRHKDYTPICSPAGDYLFSLTPHAVRKDYTKGYALASQSFSFRTLLDSEDTSDTPWWYSHSLRVRLYFILCIVFFAVLFLICIVGLIRMRGIRNMRLSTRIMYVIIVCVLAVFIYLFIMSIRYVRTNYEERQKNELLTRSEYIQFYLRSLYYWDVALTPNHANGLGIDLHDLGYDIDQDIHVYSMSGELIASSSPALFNSGVLSRRMAPSAIFSQTNTAVYYEYLADYPYLVSYVPFYNGAFVPIGYIATPYFISEYALNEEVDDLLARLLPPYIGILVLALLFSYWAAWSMTVPISALTDKMRHFEIGGEHNHIDYPYADELGALVERYNMLVDRVEESAEQLAKAEREGAWQTMARQIAHEINNPLTPMKLTVQKLQRLHGTEQFEAYFQKATPMLIAEMDNLAHIAHSFSIFAKQPEVISSQVDVARKLSDVITLYATNDEQIPIRYVGPDQGVFVQADEEQISQVFVNILRNAVQALSNRQIAMSDVDKQPIIAPDIIVLLNNTYSKKEIEISISDNGPGIPEEAQSSIFRPNFTTKSNGNGLGLAISKRIVEGTGGRITFESSEKGTTFYVYLKKKAR